MEINLDEEYRKLSRESREMMQKGNLPGYSAVLKKMSRILLAEGKRIDQVKVLMLAYYIDLSGVGAESHIDEKSVVEMQDAVVASQMDLGQFRGLYLDTVRTDVTPRHPMTVNDTLNMLEQLAIR